VPLELALDVIKRVQSYASEHPEHVALVWRWMLGEDFWSEVGQASDDLH